MSVKEDEFDFIARRLAPFAGENAFSLLDDAALLRAAPGSDLVISKDMLAAGTHFFRQDPPDLIARKALRVNLSDLIAKGAIPKAFFLGLCFPERPKEAWSDLFFSALAEESRLSGCVLLGGDTTISHGTFVISVTVIGETPAGAMVQRKGGRPGDFLYVTGTIGGAFLGLRLRSGAPTPWQEALTSEEKQTLIAAYHLPQPPLAFATALRSARACLDVSDGLIGDLEKLARASGAGFELESVRVPFPLCASAAFVRKFDLLEEMLTGGDDYQCLCAIAPEDSGAFEAAAREVCVNVARIGVLKAKPGGSVYDLEGRLRVFSRGSYAHF